MEKTLSMQLKWPHSNGSNNGCSTSGPSAIHHTYSGRANLDELHLVHTTPKTSEPVFAMPVNEAWFRKSEEGNELVKRAEAADLAFFLCRHDSETRPSWTVFNQSMSSVDPEQTALGCLSIILAPAHDLDTLNTVKRWLAISSHFGQEYTVHTVNQALYCRLMELKWCVSEYEEELIPFLCGLHCSTNFLLKAIGMIWISERVGRERTVGSRYRGACPCRKRVQQGYEGSQTHPASTAGTFDASLSCVSLWST